VDETRTLAQFVSKTGYGDLPASVIERMKVYTLDTLAAGMVGSRLPWANMVAEMAREQRGVEEASVFATPEKMTVSQAALVNGVMVGGFESEHVGHTSHPAGTVTPAALAIAERDHSSGQDFLLATALGYEVVCRIGDAQTGAVETERGFHNPAANGPFSAAAAVGKLLGIDAGTQASAFGIAGSHCGGLTEYAWDGSMTKRLHLGRASQLGLESALLAQKGFTGPHTILEGRFGYFNAFSPAPKIEKLLAGLGEQWQLETLIIKRYPCHVTSQAVVAAVQEFKRAQGVDPDQVESITIRASKRLLQQRFLDPNPTNEMGAQYSLLFTTAVAFYRDLDDPLQYDESVLDDAKIKRLANAITWEEADGGNHEALAATLAVTVGGQQHTIQAETFPGSIQTPATLSDVESKFRRFSKHVLSDAQQQDVLDMVTNLEQLDDVSKLADAIRG
jgi:2-methylcitrate dehydratase PrpD